MNAAEQALRNRLETTDFQCSFLVEAGAGAGKSHTICQRILHQLQGGRAPETIAAITFTEKAALELQEKLAAVPGEFSASEFVRSVAGVDNVCERAAVRAGGRLLRPKRAGNGVTMALAMDAVAFVAEQK